MKTRIEKIDPQAMDAAVMAEAGRLIAAGGLVAFPTETVYGLGGDAFRPEAAAAIYEAKGRPSDNPLIVHIAEFSELSRIAAEVPPEAKKLSDAFWPGPLTMVLKKSPAVPHETTGGLETVAVRMPNHPIALALIRESGCPIAAPSANASGRPSPTEAAHVAEDLDGKIAMILDGGPVGIGIESTIVDLSADVPTVLRPGFVTEEMLSDVLGVNVQLDPALKNPDGSIRPKAPGMKYRHYAPRAQMTIVDGAKDAVVREIAAMAQAARAAGEKVAVIASDETAGAYAADVVLTLGRRGDGEAAARQLYRILRKCDELGVDEIFAEDSDFGTLREAVMNRMMKAAGQRVVHAGEENR